MHANERRNRWTWALMAVLESKSAIASKIAGLKYLINFLSVLFINDFETMMLKSAIGFIRGFLLVGVRFKSETI